MKSFKLLILVALAVSFFACSSPAGSDANSTTVTNGTQNPTSAPTPTSTPTPTSNPNGNDNGNENQNGDGNNQEVNNDNENENQNGGENNQEVNNGNENGGSSTTLAPNVCDMGGDFDLNAYEYYVLGEKKHYTYSASFDKITWQNEITIESQTISDIGLEFKKQGNFLIVEKRSASNSYRINISEVKKNGNRIDITLILAN